jgi:hypothetical protein
MTYRRATLSEIRPGSVVFVDAAVMSLADTDERVNDGRTAVRVLDSDAARTGAIVVCGFPSVTMGRAAVAAVRPNMIWVQLGNPGDPLQPGAIQEHPDKAPTQLVYPPGIDMSTVGTPGGPAVPPAAVLARPAIMHADDHTWQLECPTCPLAADGPPMICAAGTRLPGGGFMMGMHCPHNHGLRQESGGSKISIGCSYSGVGHEP